MKYGRLTVTDAVARGLIGRVTVLLNGEDVTDRCTMADDLQGDLTILCRDPLRHDWRVQDGELHLTPDEDQSVCSHVLRGDVQIIERA